MSKSNRISYSLFLLNIIFLSEGYGYMHFHPPVINIAKPYIDIDANSTLELQCQGEYQVYWKLPTYAVADANDSRLSILESENPSETGKKYNSKLILKDADFTDTGLYTCYYFGTTDYSDNENASKIYVFVNDPVNLFVNNDFTLKDHIFTFLIQNRPEVIGCRPTNSKTNVTLWRTDTSEEGEIIPLSNDILFDPTEGFRILYPTIKFSGQFKCRASLDNNVQEISVTLFYIHGTYHDPQPNIDTTEAKNPVVNGTFTLKCSVSVDLGTRVHFDWRYPNKPSPRINEMTPISEKKTARNYERQEITASLIVENAELSDSGTYMCSVTDHSERTGSASTKISVHVFQQPAHVNFTTDINLSHPAVHEAGQDVKFVIAIQAFPSLSDVQLHWEKNGVLLLQENRYILKNTNRSCTLEIKKLSRTDAGVYTLFGKTKDTTNNISFILDVKDKPVVIVKNTQTFYMLGQQYNLECHADGYPTPIVWWRWQPCRRIKDCKPASQYGWTDVEPISTFPNNDSVTQEVSGIRNYSQVSYLQVTANHSGHYLCVASNEMGKADTIVPFIVTDAKNGFEVTVSNRRPVDRDSLTLICKANAYNFTDVKWMWKPMSKFDELILLENSSDVSVQLESSSYSHSLVVVFKAIHRNFSGEYECAASRESITLKQYITIDVQEIKKPVFNSTNMKGLTVTTIPESLQEFFCYVSGIPSPNITWKKDQKIFDVSNMSGVEFTEGRQRLTIRRVVEKDAGFYECVAENIGGKIKANSTLEVFFDIATSYQSGITSKEIVVISIFVVVGIALFVLAYFLVQRIRNDRKQKQELDFISRDLFERGQADIFNPDLPLEDQIDLLPYNQQLEFPKERLKLGKTLGQGAFGRVVKAEAIGLIDGEASSVVAVKMLKERADNEQRRALIAELKILIHLGRHLNMVNLLGAVTKNLAKGELMVIVEYCCYGNMRHFLLKHKSSYIDQLDPKTGKVDPNTSTLPGSPFIDTKEKVSIYSNVLAIAAMDNPTYGEQSLHYADIVHQQLKNCDDSGVGCSVVTNQVENNSSNSTCRDSQYSGPVSPVSDCYGDASDKHDFITTCDLLCFAFQCARGMEYLTSRKLIHRDLAARNVLLAKNNVVKICDFGLAKDCYKYSNYVKKSDGLLPIKWMAIESIRDRVFTTKSDVWSFGILLWEFFTLGGNPYPGIDINEEFFKKLQNGYRMEKPEFAPKSIYQIMKNCWHDDPNQRPDFTSLADKIGELLESSVRKYYTELNTPYQVMNEELLNNNEYLQMLGVSPDYTNMENSDDSKQFTWIQSQTSSPQNVYDSITSIRPVGDGPVPKAAMEVVPMIQLDNRMQPWEAPPLYQKDAPNDEFPSQTLIDRPLSYEEAENSDYLCMENTDEIDQCKNEDDDSVFLDHPKNSKYPSYVNGDYISVPLLPNTL